MKNKELPVESNRSLMVRELLSKSNVPEGAKGEIFRDLLSRSDIGGESLSIKIDREAGKLDISQKDEKSKSKETEKSVKLRGKNLGDFTVGDLADALNPQEEERVDPGKRLYKEWLGVPKLEQADVSKVYPPYKIALVSIALEEVLKKSYNTAHTLNFGYREMESVTYKDVQIDLNKTRRTVTEAHRFCQNSRGEEFVIQNTPIWGGYKVSVTTKHGLENIGSALFAEIGNWIKDNNFYRNKKIKLDGSFINVEDKSWGDIILPEDIEEEVKNNVIGLFDKRELYEANGIPFKRGVIFEGPPGNGKTLLAKVLSKELNGRSTFILATANDISSPGDVRQLYEAARELAPSVIFMEDLDAHGIDRSFGRVSPIVGEMLHQMDGIEGNRGIITLATTNYIGMIEKALKDRPSRFDRVLKLDNPQKERRLKFLKHFTKGRNVVDGDALEEAAKNTEGFSGSHMQEVANYATIIAINNGDVDGNKKVILKKSHFLDAIAKMRKQKSDNQQISPSQEMNQSMIKNAMAELIQEGFAPVKETKEVEVKS